MSTEEALKQVINLNVGGCYFCLTVADIQQFPDSYFAHLIKDEWNSDTSVPVKIDRDGLLFRHIHCYLTAGVWELNNSRKDDVQTLIAIRNEADFYNLSDLVKLCDGRMKTALSKWCENELPMRDLLSNFDCVSECEEAPSDTLIACMSSLRPVLIATARLPSYLNDQFQQSTIEETLKYASVNEIVLSQAGQYNVLEVNIFAESTVQTLKNSLTRWPFHNHNNVTIYKRNVMMFTKYGFCERRVQQNGPVEVGTYVYIFNTAFTGGTVTAELNGHKVSISQPGECLALCSGVTYSVSAVTSGVLVLIEFTAYDLSSDSARRSVQHEHVDWTTHLNGIPCTTAPGDYSIPQALQLRFVSAIAEALNTHSAVAMCLSHYYPVSSSTDSTRRFETNPDTLYGIDVQLYQTIAENFDVTVVSVYVGRIENCQKVEQTCVLDWPSDVGEEDSTCPYTKCKIIAPLYGHGHRFYISDGSGVVGVFGKQTTMWGTLLTALMVTKKI